MAQERNEGMLTFVQFLFSAFLTRKRHKILFIFQMSH